MPRCLRGRGCYREVRTPSNATLPQGEGLLQRGEDSQEGLLQRGEDSQQCHAASGGGAATER